MIEQEITLWLTVGDWVSEKYLLTVYTRDDDSVEFELTSKSEFKGVGSEKHSGSIKFE